MLDHFTIFTKNGLVLWSKTFSAALNSNDACGNPVNSLIKQAFLEQRTADQKFDKDGYTLRWTFANELDLTFVVVYQRILQLSYIDELLETVRSLFTDLFAPFVRKLAQSSKSAIASGTSKAATLSESMCLEFSTALKEWDEIFTKTLRSLEKAAAQSRRKGVLSEKKGVNNQAELATGSYKDIGQNTPNSTKEVKDAADIAKSVEALKSRLKLEASHGGRRVVRGKKSTPGLSASNGGSAPGTPGHVSGTESPGGKKAKAAKEMRKWDGSRSVSAQQVAALDFSGGTDKGIGEGADLDSWIDEKSMGKKRSDGVYEIADVFEDDDNEEDQDCEDGSAAALNGTGKSPGFLSRIRSASSSGASFFSRLTGAKTLTEEDLVPALAAMASHLQSKNVAADVAQRLCNSVERNLVGKNLGNFGSVKAEVRKALEEAITRILTPKSSTDILLEIATKRQRSAAASSLALATTAKDKELASKPDPYSICFVGVNGVGKSTNLAKVCFWLLQNRMRVLIAACDTFRAGAVEQLRVHVRNLGQLRVDGIALDEQKGRIELYERGYGKDAAGIAKDALTYAKSEGFDVVLIDTAGRMQDNEPLMRALAKLVSVNRPDKIIFVGEALVGNEAVDQITKFDGAMKDFSGVSHPRGLDGSLLTKWDAVDDKVGTALTTTSATGLPIYFLGTGQTYTDLRQLRVHHVVNALLKN
ncbi:related to SRP101 - signal recognition particle receptor, alpha chain [Melanopsichium pennsylvanicum]|uniref:Related to SRP101 - signal recognition particle receptor, alpha chain n=2 Tax=Melanopsichium pennsylvanicum TaxID=63383 RepID=A0AAJ4XIJ6_9BASI|nr:related to SRP101-signal recognition particle receptor, alpha chain [Melanopsichium pennsylvanicum 4]SNX82626.1 related to SRP101 - signal recognition particle receptor, alpha chain [Melanopsichium pennsylvanicum]